MQIDQYPCLHVVKSGTESSIPKTCKADGNGNAYAAERHILPPNEDCRFVLAIVLRLNDFHLFRSLYGESFSRSLQETFASIVTRQGKILGVVSVQQLVESMAALQVEMAKGSNPLTGLSGNLALEKELEKRIDLGSSFYIVYADLDHFKAYNDAYGFQHGDQMILLLAMILQRCQRRYGEPSDFIGHVGGDDFVLVTSADPERACRGVTPCFQRASRGCYTERDRERGCMEAQTREGGTARFSLVTVSLGILRVEGSTTLQRISERAAEVKKYAKSQTGNSFLRDRRAPLGEDERSGAEDERTNEQAHDASTQPKFGPARRIHFPSANQTSNDWALYRIVTKPSSPRKTVLGPYYTYSTGESALSLCGVRRIAPRKQPDREWRSRMHARPLSHNDRPMLVLTGMLRSVGFLATLLMVIVAFMTSTAPMAQAEGHKCSHRGDLAKRYCDDNRDMVADLPLDSSEWSNPETLIFSYVPVEDPALYKGMFQAFLDHLEEVTGKDVRYYSAQSYAAQIEAMRSGRLHVAGLSTGSTPFGVNIAGFTPFTIMGTDEGEYGYKMQVIVPDESPITSLKGLQGKTVAHTEQASNSGNQAPRALLPEQGVEPGEDYEVVYSGGHDRSILGVANGDYAAAPIASSVLDRMADRGAVDMEEIRIIHQSQSFPTTSFGHAHNLHPGLARLVQKAFFTFEFEGTKLGKEFSDVDRFIPITYKNSWKVIRTIQEQNNVAYTKENISG